MTDLDLLLPFALPPEHLAADLMRELRAPSLATLIARSRPRPDMRAQQVSSALPHETWLADRFDLAAEDRRDGSPGIAAAWMRSFDMAPEAGFWFVLHPVHIHVARDHLVLTDRRQLPLSEKESRILFDVAQPLFDEAGKKAIYADATTWFLRADDWCGLRTSTPDAACGHNVDIWMPRGDGERPWRKLQNEVQMHWFSHPVNAQREARGAPAVNSIWLWGGATGTALLGQPPYTAMFNLNGWAQGMGPASLHKRAASAADLAHAVPGRSLLVLDALVQPALAGDWSDWLVRMQALEQEWFAPLLLSLRNGKIGRITLIASGQERLSAFDTSRNAQRKFWIKPSLARLFT